VTGFWLIFWLIAFAMLGGVIGWSAHGLYRERNE
jgi:hypothetical protein